jgi:DNA primase
VIYSLAAVEPTGRIDTHALKQALRLEDVASGYGVELKRQGRALVGRCPLHADAGRPNFYVYAKQEPQTWRCYRCGIGGDVLALVMRVESVDFREAVKRLGAGRLHAAARVSRPTLSKSPSIVSRVERGPDEAAVLQAATSLYHQQLLAERRALEYLSRRGIGQETIRNHRLGYAAGDALLAYLRWRQLPLGAALHVGLLTHAGQDFLNDRLVVPNLNANGRATWLIGRALDDELPEETPKYLGLPGPKPLLGYEETRGSPSVCVVEGAFDLMALHHLGYPAVALLGTTARPDQLDLLRSFERLYLVLDADDAGFEATLQLADVIGPAAVPVALPEGIGDPAELATRPDGQALFAHALLEAVGASAPNRPDLS